MQMWSHNKPSAGNVALKLLVKRRIQTATAAVALLCSNLQILNPLVELQRQPDSCKAHLGHIQVAKEKGINICMCKRELAALSFYTISSTAQQG